MEGAKIGRETDNTVAITMAPVAAKNRRDQVSILWIILEPYINKRNKHLMTGAEGNSKFCAYFYHIIFCYGMLLTIIP